MKASQTSGDVLADLRTAKTALVKARQGQDRRDSALRQAEAARARSRRAMAEAERAYNTAREAVAKAYPDA